MRVKKKTQVKKSAIVVLSICIISIVFIAIMGINALATTTPTLVAQKIEESESVQRGDTVTYTVSLENSSNTEFHALTFYLSYDSESLILEDYDVTYMISALKSGYFVIADDGEIGFTLYNLYGDDYVDYAFDGVLATLTFTVSDTAAGEVNVNFTSKYEYAYYDDETEVCDDLESEDGYIFVNVPVDTSTIAVSPTSINLDLADSETSSSNVTLSYEPEDTTTDMELSYSSSDTSVATVSYSEDTGDFTVTGVSNGTATITINAFGKTKTIDVAVTTSVSSIEFDKSNIKLVMGSTETDTITATVYPTTAQDAELTWSSSDTSVATVDQNGNITAVGDGTATITATASNGVTQTATVIVYVPITNATVTPNEDISLNKGDTEQLSVSVEPNGATYADDITYTSSDTSVVTVDENGLITAVGAGTATITINFGEDDYTITKTVTVVIPLEGITVDNSSIELIPGGSHTIVVTPNPTDYTKDDDETMTYSGYDTSIISVDSDGVITALNEGSTTVTVTLQDCTATVDVKVLKAIEGVSISDSYVTLNTSTNPTDTLSVIINPTDAEESYTIEWSSSDSSIVSVDQDGNIIGLASGSATITATITHSGTTEEVTATVTVYVPVESIAGDTSAEVDKGGTYTINATITPDTATNKTITWASSDESIATVDSNGVVTGISTGTVIITGTVEDGNTIEVAVSVVQRITSVTLDTTGSVTLEKGDTTTVSATISPEDTTEDTTITWTSSDTSVAVVDSNGYIVAIGGGTAYITATAGSAASEKLTVNVVVPMTGFTIVTDENSVTINQGDSQTLSITVTPSDTTEADDITWTSSDETIATVDSNGVVTGISAGTVTVTATIGNYTSSIEITVQEISEDEEDTNGTIEIEEDDEEDTEDTTENEATEVDIDDTSDTDENPKTGNVSLYIYGILSISFLVGICIIIRKLKMNK